MSQQSPLARYAALMRSLPDKEVGNPRQPLLVSLSEHLGAPSGMSVDASAFLGWAAEQGRITAVVQWRLRESLDAWEKKKPLRSQIAELMDWLDKEVMQVVG